MLEILVIDDDPIITNMIEVALTGADVTVKTVHGGLAGLKMLKRMHFDVVITDILMPDFDGFELIMAIERMPNPPRVIAITGGSARLSQEYLAQAIHAFNVQHLLYKPFTVTELYEVVFQDGAGEECG